MGKNITIGITGGIGAGKSIVSRVLRCNGFKVFDCDYEAKVLMNKNIEIKKALINLLGNSIYSKDGVLNRKTMATLIFSDPKKLQQTNNIVHRSVRKEIIKDREKISGRFFIESAILMSGGISPLCDQVWVVTAPLELREKRVEKRDGMKPEEIKNRIKSQEKEISLLKDFPIIHLENDDHSSLLPEILRLVDRYNHLQTYTITC